MKILFIGDIFGRAGRDIIKKLLPEIKQELKPDLVIANAENLTNGSGFSYKHIQEMKKAGIDFFTSGNHVWSNKDGVQHLDDKTFPVLRPANYPPGVAGRGSEIVKVGRKKVLVVNLMGRSFIRKHFDCPMRTMDDILEKYKKEKLSAIFVDYHAETTAEKYALGYYLDGKVSAVIGTHTHVPTADAHILAKGTAYITDAGMTGPFESVIGVKKEIVLEKFLTQIDKKHEPETKGKKVFSGVIIEIDEKTKKALNIKHVLKFS